MRTYILSSVLVVLSTLLFAQPPQKMSYQCVVRNASGTLITNQNVRIRISILQGNSSGTAIYTETQTPTTNVNGLVSIEIGGGVGFDAINWASGPYFLKTETDPSGGTNYTISGTSQLLSVPYALYSTKAQTTDYNNLTNRPNLSGYLTTESDPVFAAAPSHGITSGSITNWNTAYSWGNHSGLYRPISYVPSWTDVTGKPGFATVATSGSYNDLINKPTILNSQWTTSGNNLYFNTGNVGIGTTSPSALLHTEGTGTGEGNVVFIGQYKSSNPGNPPINTGFATRMMWYPDKAAFRVGVNGPDDDNIERIGDFSFASGNRNRASGFNSVAMGEDNQALGNSSISLGSVTYAGGNFSTALGSGTAAFGDYSTVMGYGTRAKSYCSTVLGCWNEYDSQVVYNYKTWVATDPIFEIGNGAYEACHNAMTVLKNGNVGFGTASPVAGLHIKADTWPGSFIYLEANIGQDAGMRLYEGSAERWHIYNNAAAGGLQIKNNALATAVFCQQSSSNVGIGTTTPFYKLQVGNAGDGTEARANAWNILSDARLKKDFADLTNALEMVGKINGYYFYWSTGTDKTRQIGFSAQQISEVVPEIVSKGEDGYLSLEYGKMAPLLIEAIKELKTENDNLRARLDKIEKLLGLSVEDSSPQLKNLRNH